MGKDSFTVQVDPEFKFTPETLEFYRECIWWGRFLSRLTEGGISLKFDIVGTWNSDSSPASRASFHWNGRHINALQFHAGTRVVSIGMLRQDVLKDHSLYAHEKIAQALREGLEYAVMCEENKIRNVAFLVRDEAFWKAFLDETLGVRPQVLSD